MRGRSEGRMDVEGGAYGVIEESVVQGSRGGGRAGELIGDE